MDTPADDPAAAATARADDPAPKVSHVRRSIPPSIVTFFYANNNNDALLSQTWVIAKATVLRVRTVPYVEPYTFG
jgi:hypothetical protein